MPKIKLKQVDQIWRKSVSDAQTSFIRHCQLKNLAPYTVKYSNIVLSRFSRKLETRKQGICNTKRLLGKRPNPLEHITSDVG